MATKKTPVPPKDKPDQLPAEWQEQAQRAARRFKIPILQPDDVGPTDEAEQRLNDFEQEGGE